MPCILVTSLSLIDWLINLVFEIQKCFWQSCLNTKPNIYWILCSACHRTTLLACNFAWEFKVPNSPQTKSNCTSYFWAYVQVNELLIWTESSMKLTVYFIYASSMVTLCHCISFHLLLDMTKRCVAKQFVDDRHHYRLLFGKHTLCWIIHADKPK